MIPFPDKRYNIIYADPPWRYNDKQTSGGTAYFGAEVRYTTMPIDDICNLPIKDISAKDSVLFLWVVSPLLPEGIRTLQTWGYKYKTIAFCWSKVTKNGKKVSNIGRWTMGNNELCLLLPRLGKE